MKEDPILGIQMSPISMLHEGSDHVYSLLKDEAGLNAVFIYCSTYQIWGWDRHKRGKLADDHGVPPPDFDYCDTRNTWFTAHPHYYRHSPAFHSDDEGKRFADRDVFAEALEKTEEHGFQVYARALEAENGSPIITGWNQVCAVDCFGRTSKRPCPNNPTYIAWWLSTVEDLFKSYHGLAGLKYGEERPGPLSLALFNGPGFWYSHLAPDCFCGHCQRRLAEKGFDPERAKQGYRKLVELRQGLHEGTADRRDGALVTALRILFQYPEVIAHNQEYMQSHEDLHARMAGAVHTFKPSALFGLHIYQGATAWDFVHRASLDFQEMANYVDFLKPVIYQTVAGPRMKGYLDAVKDGIFSDFEPEFALQLLYGLQGFKGPAYDRIETEGFSVDYVYQETKRCVEGLGGKALTLAGPGFDIGGPSELDSPDIVYETISACFDAGAEGLIVSREYDEMQRPRLQAVGKAIAKRF